MRWDIYCDRLVGCPESRLLSSVIRFGMRDGERSNTIMSAMIFLSTVRIELSDGATGK